MLPMMLIGIGALITLGMILFAFAGPSAQKTSNRRLSALRERHSTSAEGAMEAQMRRITGRNQTKADKAAMRLLPNPAELQKRLNMTGKSWTVGQYGMVSLGLAVGLTLLMLLRGWPLLLALFLGLGIGAGFPHWWVGKVINKRVAKFNTKFPDAIELLVRGLRSGLPISETMSVVGTASTRRRSCRVSAGARISPTKAEVPAPVSTMRRSSSASCGPRKRCTSSVRDVMSAATRLHIVG